LRPAYSPSRRGAPRVPARGTTSPMGRRTGDLVVQPLSQAAHPVGEEAAELPRPRALRRGHHRVARTCGIGSKETLGAGSLAVRADVSNLPDLDTMFATIKREFGHLDGVFVNAGYSEFLLFEQVTEQSFDKVIAVNFKGAYFTIQKALPLLRQGSSVVINASVGARKGWPTTSTVSTCKAAVVHLARILS